MIICLEEVDFQFHVVKQVFINGDGSVGIFYLGISDFELTYGSITILYSK
jgi:hypothetical protein